MRWVEGRREEGKALGHVFFISDPTPIRDRSQGLGFEHRRFSSLSWGVLAGGGEDNDFAGSCFTKSLDRFTRVKRFPMFEICVLIKKNRLP